MNVAARLETEAPPGGIVVSRAVREAVDGRLKATLHPMGELTLKNIERPIQAFRVEWKAEDWPVSPAAPPQTVAAAPRSGLAPQSEPPRLSIVVLPFANIGGDPEHEYFVDGVTESLTTDLSRMGGMLVIARNTAFTYKGKSVDIIQVGRELNTRFALEGSVQRSADRMRVNVQLIDTEDQQPPVGGAFRQARGRSLRHAGRNRRAARPTIGHAADRRRSAARRTGADPRFPGPLLPGHGRAEHGQHPRLPHAGA